MRSLPSQEKKSAKFFLSVPCGSWFLTDAGVGFLGFCCVIISVAAGGSAPFGIHAATGYGSVSSGQNQIASLSQTGTEQPYGNSGGVICDALVRNSGFIRYLGLSRRHELIDFFLPLCSLLSRPLHRHRQAQVLHLHAAMVAISPRWGFGGRCSCAWLATKIAPPAR